MLRLAFAIAFRHAIDALSLMIAAFDAMMPRFSPLTFLSLTLRLLRRLMIITPRCLIFALLPRYVFAMLPLDTPFLRLIFFIFFFRCFLPPPATLLPSLRRACFLRCCRAATPRCAISAAADAADAFRRLPLRCYDADCYAGCQVMHASRGSDYVDDCFRHT